jgi:RHS repeat-associated protein
MKIIVHDSNGNLTSASTSPVVLPVGSTSHMSYDATFNLIQAQDPVGNSTQLSYDAQGHLTGVKDPLGAVTSASYNGNGAVSSITDALGRKDVMTRDPLSRVTLNTDAAGNQTSFSYDPVGHTTQVKDALNGTTNVAYQAGRSGRFPASVTDAKGHATSFTYDTTGRVTSVKNALNQSASITYNLKSLPVSVQTRNGQTISFAYDSLDRLTTLNSPEGSLSLSYDAVGNLLTANHYNGSALSLSYDAVNRVTQVGQTLTNGFTANIGYGYDANGNRTRMTTPWGAFSYAYDALDRVTSITNPNGQTVTFTYDAASRRTSMSYPNGTKTTYAYDAAGQVTQIVHQKTSNQTAIAFDNYTYDADGNRIQISDLVGAHTFAYDKLNRLTAANHPGTSSLPTQAETFAYDAIGNRTSDAQRTGYTYDAANRIVSDSSFTYTSDANGNQTSRTSRSTGNTTTFVYDNGNRLTQVSGPSGTIATYKYDAAGRRIEKNVGGTITRYIFDGANILATLDGSNNLTALFTQGPGIDSPLIGRINGTDYFYHADALGSVIALTDTNGNTVETTEYTAFGQPIIKDAQGITHGQSTVGNTMLYTGTDFDPETGLNHMGYRYQDSTSGRFNQEDPVAHINEFVYAGASPLSRKDPLGLCPTGSGIDYDLSALDNYLLPVDLGFQWGEDNGSSSDINFLIGGGGTLTGPGGGFDETSGGILTLGGHSDSAGLFSSHGADFDGLQTNQLGLFAGGGGFSAIIFGDATTVTTNRSIGIPGSPISPIFYSDGARLRGFGISYGPSIGFAQTNTMTQIYPIIKF